MDTETNVTKMEQQRQAAADIQRDVEAMTEPTRAEVQAYTPGAIRAARILTEHDEPSPSMVIDIAEWRANRIQHCAAIIDRETAAPALLAAIRKLIGAARHTPDCPFPARDCHCQLHLILEEARSALAAAAGEEARP